MRNKQRAAGFSTGPILRAIVLCLCFFALRQQLQAQTRVVAWGAGTTANINAPTDYGQSIVPANLTNATEVIGGWQQSLAVKADGTVAAWGYDQLGVLDLPPADDYVAVACGYEQSLALETNGTVVAVGYYSQGATEVPENLTNAVAVASGFYHCLALKSDGTVAAWGGGEDNPDYEGTVPVGLSNVVAIAAGGYHNLVLKSDGTLFAWGENAGYGETNIPAGLSNVIAIAAGAYHNLALKANGTVVAWGLNDYGQTNVPADLSNVVAVSAGDYHNLALKSNGTVVAWGENTEGDTSVPVNLTNVDQISAGSANSLALIGAGTPVTGALLTSPTMGTNGFSILVPTRNGRAYQLEYKNSLTDTVWQALPLCAGTGKMLRLADPGSATQRYYRVMRW